MEPKKHTLSIAEINRDTFYFIRSGKKKIETRACSPKYRKVKAGEILVLSCAGEKFERKIKKVFYFTSIKEILKKYTPNQINPAVHTEQEITQAWHSYPGYKEKIKKFGLIAFEL